MCFLYKIHEMYIHLYAFCFSAVYLRKIADKNPLFLGKDSLEMHVK